MSQGDVHRIAAACPADSFGKLVLDPAVDGTGGDASIAINLCERQVLIAGTEYAGEMKKSVFTLMNYLLPLQNVLSITLFNQP